MRKMPAAILSLLAFAPVFAALPAKATSSALPTPAQADCAAVNPSKGEEKFTGKSSGGPTGTLIEVTSSNQTVLVRYSNSVLVCEGGQSASVNVLTRGANVVVYGPMKREGKVLKMTAAKILFAGSP